LQVSFWRRALPLTKRIQSDARALALGAMGCMAAFLAHGLVDASFFYIDLAYVFFFDLALIQWVRRNEV
jgi:hypothetical protein